MDEDNLFNLVLAAAFIFSLAFAITILVGIWLVLAKWVI